PKRRRRLDRVGPRSHECGRPTHVAASGRRHPAHRHLPAAVRHGRLPLRAGGARGLPRGPGPRSDRRSGGPLRCATLVDAVRVFDLWRQLSGSRNLLLRLSVAIRAAPVPKDNWEVSWDPGRGTITDLSDADREPWAAWPTKPGTPFTFPIPFRRL